MASAPLALLLTGCAGASDRYPSLATRDIERVSGTFEPVTASDSQLTSAPAPANQGEQLQGLVKQAANAHAAFMAAVPGTRAAVAGIETTEPGDKSWTDAQIALAELDSQRSRAAIALGDLDLLYANASVDFVEREAIAEARANVLASVKQEDAILIELRGLADR